MCLLNTRPNYGDYINGALNSFITNTRRAGGAAEGNKAEDKQPLPPRPIIYMAKVNICSIFSCVSFAPVVKSGFPSSKIGLSKLLPQAKHLLISWFVYVFKSNFTFTST